MGKRVVKELVETKCPICGNTFLPIFTGKRSSTKTCSDFCNRKREVLRVQRYYYKHREDILARKNLERNLDRGRDPLKYLLDAAKGRAKKKGLGFDLVQEELDVPGVCPVLGTRFDLKTEYCMSLDRIDSTKGYTKDNIQILSLKANTMKNSATPEEMLKFADWVYKTYG